MENDGFENLFLFRKLINFLLGNYTQLNKAIKIHHLENII